MGAGLMQMMQGMGGGLPPQMPQQGMPMPPQGDPNAQGGVPPELLQALMQLLSGGQGGGDPAMQGGAPGGPQAPLQPPQSPVQQPPADPRQGYVAGATMNTAQPQQGGLDINALMQMIQGGAGGQ